MPLHTVRCASAAGSPALMAASASTKPAVRAGKRPDETISPTRQAAQKVTHVRKPGLNAHPTPPSFGDGFEPFNAAKIGATFIAARIPRNVRTFSSKIAAQRPGNGSGKRSSGVEVSSSAGAEPAFALSESTALLNFARSWRRRPKNNADVNGPKTLCNG